MATEPAVQPKGRGGGARLHNGDTGKTRGHPWKRQARISLHHILPGQPDNSMGYQGNQESQTNDDPFSSVQSGVFEVPVRNRTKDTREKTRVRIQTAAQQLIPLPCHLMGISNTAIVISKLHHHKSTLICDLWWSCCYILPGLFLGL